MSIHLFREDLKTGVVEVFPICSTSSFVENWLPIVESLQLDVMKEMQCLPLNPDVVELFLLQLNAFQKHVMSNEGIVGRATILESIALIQRVIVETEFPLNELSIG